MSFITLSACLLCLRTLCSVLDGVKDLYRDARLYAMSRLLFSVFHDAACFHCCGFRSVSGAFNLEGFVLCGEAVAMV